MQRIFSFLNLSIPILLLFTYLTKSIPLLALTILLSSIIVLSFFVNQKEKTIFIILLSMILIVFMDLRYEILPHFYIGLADLIFLPFVALSILKFFKSKEDALPQEIIFFFIFMMGFTVIGFFYSRNTLLNLRYLITLLYIFSFINIYWHEIDSQEKLIKSVKVLILASLYPLFIAGLELLFGRDINALHQFTYSFADRGIRISGIFAGPNALSYFLSFMVPLILLKYHNDMENKKYLILLIVVLVAILLSGSRAGFLFVFIFLTGYYLLSQITGGNKFTLRKILTTSAIILSVFILGYFLLEARFKGDYTLTNDISIISRYFVWTSAFSLFQSNPLLGIGFGNFTFEYEKFFHVNEKMFLEISGLYHAHNFIFHILAEIGIVGLLIVLIFIILLFRKIVALLKADSIYIRKTGAAILAATVGIFVSQLFDFVIADPKHFTYIFITAIYFITIIKYHRLNL